MSPTTKILYANFPERDLKVVFGDNINANTAKTLRRMSIGTYEMSFAQQERMNNSASALKSAVNAMGRAGWTVTHDQHRDFVGVATAANAERTFSLWITTPFELTQTSHVVWCKCVETVEEGQTPKVGVAFKLATAFTVDDFANIMKAAQKNVVELPAGQPYTLKGNPPPRFQKKAADTAPAAVDTEAISSAADAAAAAEAAGDQPAG
jgi:hypothetical protein